MLRCCAILIACVLGVAPMASGENTSLGRDGPEVTISHVSGKPVPRFEALRFGRVNGRTGPSEDHSVAWDYQRVGLPVLVLKETEGWRYVRDPDGAEVWMHARMLTESGTAMALSHTTLMASPRRDARAVAEMEAGAVVTLGRCETGYCHVSSGRHGGWAPRAALWGASVPTIGAAD